ncbi:hypothetical protein EV401DRAFT_1849847 [Pisolithus croceorrhizus]|nr:hypothetical protein EV401DRAFT_1849847 [Pisolithus croceorrhizus]
MDVKLSVLDSSCSKNTKKCAQNKKPKILKGGKCRSIGGKHELELEVSLEGRSKEWKVKALVDSGANDIFLNKKWAEENNVPLLCLGRPISVLNVDGTKNATGDITHIAAFMMNYQGH